MKAEKFLNTFSGATFSGPEKSHKKWCQKNSYVASKCWGDSSHFDSTPDSTPVTQNATGLLIMKLLA